MLKKEGKYYTISGCPGWVYSAWADGAGMLYCAADTDLPISKTRRAYYRIWGKIKCFLFDWWWWDYVEVKPKGAQ